MQDLKVNSSIFSKILKFYWSENVGIILKRNYSNGMPIVLMTLSFVAFNSRRNSLKPIDFAVL